MSTACTNFMSIQSPPAYIYQVVPFEWSTITTQRNDIRWSQLDRLLADAKLRINGAAELETGWGPYEGEKISREIIVDALNAIESTKKHFLPEYSVPSLIFAAPGSDGSIGIEFERSNKSLTLVFGPEKSVEVTRGHDNKFEENTTQVRALNLEEELRWMAS